MTNKNKFADLAYNFNFLDYLNLKLENKLTKSENDFLESLFLEDCKHKSVLHNGTMFGLLLTSLSLNLNKKSTLEEKLSFLLSFLENNPILVEKFPHLFTNFIEHFTYFYELKYSDIEKHLSLLRKTTKFDSRFSWFSLLQLEDEQFRHIDLMFKYLFKLDSKGVADFSKVSKLVNFTEDRNNPKIINLSLVFRNGFSRKLGLSKVLESNIRHLNSKLEDIQKSSTYEVNYKINVCFDSNTTYVSLQSLVYDSSNKCINTYPRGSEVNVLKGFETILLY